jgi:hypothetical protein
MWLATTAESPVLVEPGKLDRYISFRDKGNPMTGRRAFIVGSLVLLTLPSALRAEEAGRPAWRKLAGQPGKHQLDRTDLARSLALAPLEHTEAARESDVVVELPMPDGALARFRILESPILPARMTQKYGIRTYAARGLDDPAATARFDLGPTGFHALILGSMGAIVIRPDGEESDRYVSMPYDEDPLQEAVRCVTNDIDLPSPGERLDATATTTAWSDEYAIYRLAVAATGEFTAANGGTKASALAAITTTINGVNAIYRRDLGIHLDLLEGFDSVIYTDGSTDPYTSGSLNCSVNTCGRADCLAVQNQCVLDIVFGSAGYDIGIVFDSNGVGGRAIGATCTNSNKGSASTSGTSVDLAAHEIAHMFNAHHTFNDGTNGSCGSFLGVNQREADYAWEPGSGSTIMSYAGACGAANLQNGRSLDFHHRNVMDVRAFVAGAGASCADYAFSGNYPPVVQSVTGPVTVPAKTPFMLDVGFYDPQDDPVTVSWEQEDTGTASPPETDDGSRPLFRAYPPRDRSSRSFPNEPYVRFNGNVPPPTAITGNLTGETQVTTSRILHFGAILRDGADGVTITGVAVTVDAGSGPFAVTTPAASTIWTQGTRKTVTWNPAGTNAGAVNCQNVRILLSVDDGITWSYVLAGSTPNDGSETVTLPFELSVVARIKVEAVGNIFYDMSEKFTIDTLSLKNTNDSGYGSLRQAILDANDWPTGATIPIVIPGSGVRTIHVSSQLPTITKPFALDGWELGGAAYTGPPLLEIEGAGCPTIAGIPCDGLVIQGDNTLINGVVVRNFLGNGVVFRGAAAYASSVQNSYIGTNAAGTAAAGNGLSGVLIDGGYGDPLYGNALFGNVISGNQVGVTINGASANRNALFKNIIGLNAAGTARIPNLDDGIRIVGAPNTIVGEPGFGNVIAGNGTLLNGVVDRYADAIDIGGAGASGTKIQANILGLDALGATGVFNTSGNIRVTDASNTLIGGTAAGARNVIGDDGTVNYHFAHCIGVFGAGATGTVIQGNYLGTDANGALDRGCRGAGVYVENAPAVQIGGTTAAARNVISGNNDYGGVWVTGSTATGTQIQGNYIGTDVTGAAALPNNPFGIELLSGANTIGGASAGARNVISGNTQRGIDMSELGASNNVIQGNFIGTNAAGTAAIGNGTYGIHILRAENNLIGGTVPGARNVISGNGDRGIFISGSPPSEMCPGNTIQGNYIGTDVTGTAGIGNAIGIELSYVANVSVGGSVPGAGNVISAARSGNTGVRVYAFGTSTSGIVIQGNKIGTNAAGTAALGNTGEGIWASIGGSASILGNVVAASGLNGISLGTGSFTVKGNWIGTDVTGTLDLRNTWSGIYTTSQSPCTIGGTAPGDGNVIAFSSPPATGTNHAGLSVVPSASRQTIRGNRIFSNTGLGIDVGPSGITGNDACDADSGANEGQNFPVVTAAHQSGSATHVTGTLNSTAGTSFAIDFYASPSCDALGNGEGSTYVGSTNVSTDGSCNAAFDLLVPVPSSGVVTATATDPLGNTSEFSACRTVGPSPVAEVTGVVWPGKTELTWSAAAGATSYRVLRGKPTDLPDLLDTDPDSCTRFNGSALTTGPTLSETPLTTTPYYWYLVVGSNGVDDGPYGAATAGPRIANAAGSCP